MPAVPSTRSALFLRRRASHARAQQAEAPAAPTARRVASHRHGPGSAENSKTGIHHALLPAPGIASLQPLTHLGPKEHWQAAIATSERDLVICRAWLCSKAPAWARLGRARAHRDLEPGPGRQLGLGSAGLRLRPGLQGEKWSNASPRHLGHALLQRPPLRCAVPCGCEPHHAQLVHSVCEAWVCVVCGEMKAVVGGSTSYELVAQDRHLGCQRSVLTWVS
jgi:hypothetical protein